MSSLLLSNGGTCTVPPAAYVAGHEGVRCETVAGVSGVAAVVARLRTNWGLYSEDILSTNWGLYSEDILSTNGV